MRFAAREGRRARLPTARWPSGKLGFITPLEARQRWKY